MTGHRAILLVTARADLAADLLVLAARDRGLRFIRFNQDDFPQHAQIVWRTLGDICFAAENTRFSHADVSGAWFRRRPARAAQHDPGSQFAIRGADAFLDCVWATVPWFWMNHPAAVSKAELKLLQLQQARRLGMSIPDTVVGNAPSTVRAFAGSKAIIVKSLASGAVELKDGLHAIFSTVVEHAELRRDDEISACPAIFQARVPAAFDARVTVVGQQVFAARIITLDRTASDVDWRRADPARLRYERHTLPAELEARCVELVATMGLTYGALDFVVSPQGEHVFLELNPSGQWGWIERALGLPITDAILDLLGKG